VSGVKPLALACILLYPRTTRDVAVEFTTQSHRIRALTLDLAQPWKSIHGALMRIMVGDPQADDIGVLARLSDM
jgi:hypothetical protein